MAFTHKNVPVSGGPSSMQVALMPQSTITATVTGTGNIIGVDCFSVAEVLLVVGTVSGTTPTFDIYVQKLLADNATWDDIIHFPQITSSTQVSLATMVVGNQALHTPATRSIAASTIRSTSLGGIWRVDIVVGGSTPSAVIQVLADFYV